MRADARPMPTEAEGPAASRRIAILDLSADEGGAAVARTIAERLREAGHDALVASRAGAAAVAPVLPPAFAPDALVEIADAGEPGSAEPGATLLGAARGLLGLRGRAQGGRVTAPVLRLNLGGRSGGGVPARLPAPATDGSASVALAAPTGRMLEILATRVLVAVAPLPRLRATEAEAADAALLAACAERHDFSGYSQLEAMRRQDPADPATVDHEAPDGPRRVRAVATVGEGAAGLPLTRYLAHLRAALPASGGDPDCPWGAHRLARWYASEAAAAMRGGTAPVGPALAAWLNADAGDPSDGGPRMSRFVRMEALRHAPAIARSGTEAELAFWWVHAHAGPRGQAAELTPPHLLAELHRVPPAGRGTPFPLGAALLEAHRGSATYRGIYDLQEATGRIAFVFDLILHAFDAPVRRQMFNPDALGWLAAPLAGGSGLGRLEALAALHAGVAEAADIADPASAPRIRRWFRGRAAGAFPSLGRFATLPEAEWLGSDRTFELVGMATSGTGLGTNLAMSERALAEAGIAATLRDSEAGFARAAPRVARPARPAPALRKAALLHLNADAVPQVLCHPFFDRHPDIFQIGYLLWELEALPEAHRLGLDLLDEIWCPSGFLRDVFARRTDTPVTAMGKAIELPDVAPFARRPLGLGRDDFCFVLAFDFHSSVERKNPLAAVRAFRAAFAGEGDGDVRLIVKTTAPVAGHWGDPRGMWPRVLSEAEADPRIRILAETQPFTELLALLRGADCILSPHRAEGFGYFPAWGLAYGRPVIATDYSATCDFLTGETGWPVAWRPREVAPDETILPVADAFWADVEIDALAAAMRHVRDDPEASQARASAGRALMAREYAPEALARRYGERLRALGIVG